jgi:signal recognition particle receptor subunit beta
MDSVRSDRNGGSSRIPTALKILIAGGFGAGKTTMVGSVSEIRPLQTEEILTGVEGADDLSGVEGKTTTTVTMDFGRITITDDLQLYLFGTPGQDRFWFLWDELSEGALGAVVLADTRRLADCFPSIDYFEQRGTPFVVAVNCFDDEHRFAADAVARALDLDPGVPVVLFDAREPSGARNVLIELVEYVARRQLASAGSRCSGPREARTCRGAATPRAGKPVPAQPGKLSAPSRENCPRPARKAVRARCTPVAVRSGPSAVPSPGPARPGRRPSGTGPGGGGPGRSDRPSRARRRATPPSRPPPRG